MFVVVNILLTFINSSEEEKMHWMKVNIRCDAQLLLYMYSV